MSLRPHIYTKKNSQSYVLARPFWNLVPHLDYLRVGQIGPSSRPCLLRTLPSGSNPGLPSGMMNTVRVGNRPPTGPPHTGPEFSIPPKISTIVELRTVDLREERRLTFQEGFTSRLVV